MTTLALLMFNLGENEGIRRNIERLRSLVDEIVIIDSSPVDGYRELLALVESYGARVYRALPLGHPEPLRPFGVSKVTADYVFLLDADEEPSPGLLARMRQLNDHEAYVIPRREVELQSFTYHLRLFRRDAVRFAGRSFDFPVVQGSIGYLDRTCAILHHARVDTYLSDKGRARRYFTVENYERPFTRRYFADALSFRFGDRTRRWPVPRQDAERPLSPPAIRCVIEVEFLRDLLLGRGSRAAAFNRRYSLGKARFLWSLPPSERARFAAISKEIQEAGGLFSYLNFADAGYVERLTSGFSWDRPGIEVYEELLADRHARGKPKPASETAARPAGSPAVAAPRPGPCVSVVIPTHDRPEKLRALLASLRVAVPADVDSIIIVDDSEAPIDAVAEFPDLPVKHLRLDHRVFISRAKNLGWRAASSPFVFFVDDDNVVTRETLQRPLATMASSREIGAIVPAVLYKQRPDLVWVYATPLAPSRWGHTLLGRNRPRNTELEGRWHDTDAMPNAVLVRKDALESVGGFREALEVNSSADAALRLKAKGWRVLADSGAFILHDVEPPGRVGYWSQHGAADPERVFHEVRDWFVLMRSVHAGERLFAVRATWHALGFILPNGMTYLLRGGSRGRRAFGQMLRGYLSGLRGSMRESRHPLAP